ncbi:unnamed protein product [Ilex paraguariensis]|uniref:Uncharacterized protein n=1 Tax=Ilex paraguariensis TaxID=185542 RepID=A0ABC8T157_9AQUA
MSKQGSSQYFGNILKMPKGPVQLLEETLTRHNTTLDQSLKAGMLFAKRAFMYTTISCIKYNGQSGTTEPWVFPIFVMHLLAKDE